MKAVDIDIDYLKTVNYALFHNRIPVCQSVHVVNNSEQPLDDVKVCCKGEFIKNYESNPVGRINAGETVRIMPFEISPDASKLAILTERVITGFTLTITSLGEIIEEKQYEIELMPYDHWLGTTILPQTLASFVSPNHPSINGLVVKAAAALKQATGSSVLTAYQTCNSNDVRLQTAAVFAAIHQTGIVYRGVPASYEDVGQRITMPDQVISNKIGNCIE
ncbi:MAG: DNA helicase, partial [Candidatus Paraprevotella stercoravium]|nr:DNA helicase [Candidatus Paraprevotella stercoravium]